MSDANADNNLESEGKCRKTIGNFSILTLKQNNHKLSIKHQKLLRDLKTFISLCSLHHFFSRQNADASTVLGLMGC